MSAQIKNPDRLNILVDGKYRFSLDISQVVDLGIKVGNDYSDDELTELEAESQFGKLYSRALEYCIMRPHSAREVHSYLWRKTQNSRYKSRDGTIHEREGISQSIADRVHDKLVQKGYIDDEKFARFWVENRNLTKGSSSRKLISELRVKGVEQSIIESVIGESDRSDESEIQKILAKKRAKYPDDQKLIAYLARQGFSYDKIKDALSTEV